MVLAFALNQKIRGVEYLDESIGIGNRIACRSLSISSDTVYLSLCRVRCLATAKGEKCLARYQSPVYTPYMNAAKLFTNGRSQAVRLPKEFRFEGSEVMVTRLGSAVVLLAKDQGWDVLFEAVEGFSEDFMAQREQPSIENRNLEWEG